MNRPWRAFVLAVAVSMIGGALQAGCAERRTAPAPSQRQVQSDADRFFEKMKQEEREHGAESEKKEAGDTGY